MFSSDQIIQALRSSGIRVEFNDKLPTCVSKLGSDGYKIILGVIYIEGDESAKQYLLRHEIMHIARGDLVNKQEADKTIDNIAMDCCIAHSIGEKEAKRLNGITWEALGDETLPKPVGGWRPLAKALKEKAINAGIGFCKIEPNPGEIEKHKDTVIKLRAHGLDQMMPQIRADPYTPIIKRTITSIEKILKHIKNNQGSLRIKTRTRSRPGRIEELKGSAIVPKAKLLLAVDCSGSMESLINKAISIAFWAEKEYKVDLIAWNSNAIKIDKNKLIRLSASGGTDPNSIWPLIPKYDATVIITDGYFDKIRPPESVPPIIWWVFETEHNIELRPVDRLFKGD